MDRGKYKKWDPIPNLIGRYSCESVHDDWEGFRVIIKYTDQVEAFKTGVFRFYFDSQVLYLNRDESDMLLHSEDTDEFDFPHPFYIVENSELLNFYHKQSSGVRRDENIKHFAIYTIDDCIDVLAYDYPEIQELGH